MPLESLKETCKACLRYLSNYLVLGAIALTVLGIVGRSALEKWLTGQVTMIAAWLEFQAHVAGFLDNPIVRLGFIFLALWMFSRGAISVRKQVAMEKQQSHQQYEQIINDVRSELAKEYALPRNLAIRDDLQRQLQLLINGYHKTRSELDAYRVMVEKPRDQYDLSHARGKCQNRIASNVTELRSLAGTNERWRYPATTDNEHGAELRFAEDAEKALPIVSQKIRELGSTLGQSLFEIQERLKNG